MYESRKQRPLIRQHFVRRLLAHLLIASAIMIGSILFGIWGYAHFENLSIVDAFLNSAMLLGGMGPVNPPLSTAGKIFAGCYALYAGLIFIVTAALIFTPLIHRILHKFHWDS